MWYHLKGFRSASPHYTLPQIPKKINSKETLKNKYRDKSIHYHKHSPTHLQVLFAKPEDSRQKQSLSRRPPSLQLVNLEMGKKI